MTGKNPLKYNTEHADQTMPIPCRLAASDMMNCGVRAVGLLGIAPALERLSQFSSGWVPQTRGFIRFGAAYPIQLYQNGAARLAPGLLFFGRPVFPDGENRC